MLAQVVLRESGAIAVLFLSFAWLVFVVVWMITVSGHLGAIRRRLAPEPEPIVWDTKGERYGLGVWLQREMYGIWERDRGPVPVAVFPFSAEGRREALDRMQSLEASASGTPS